MAASGTLGRLGLILAEVCAVEPSAIRPQARLRGYGLDSVRITELVLSIEAEFDVRLRVEEMGEIDTVEELALYVDRRQAGFGS